MKPHIRPNDPVTKKSRQRGKELSRASSVGLHARAREVGSKSWRGFEVIGLTGRWRNESHVSLSAAYSHLRI